VNYLFFLFGNKRKNIRAWEYALFEGKNDYLALPNIPLYEQLTEAQIQNDCRIIAVGPFSSRPQAVLSSACAARAHFPFSKKAYSGKNAHSLHEKEKEITKL